MTVKAFSAAMACVAMSGLMGCSKGAPTGQVIAVANGEEITVSELQAEASARNVQNANDPAARSMLLREILDRKLWAQDARHRKLDQQVQYMLAKRRAEDVLLADMQLRRLSDTVASPSDADVDQFLRANPSAFVSRTTFAVDQINARSDDAGLAGRLADAKTLEEADALLAKSGIVGQRSRTEWNSVFMPAALAKTLNEMPLHTLFVRREGPTLIAAVVTARTEGLLSDTDRRILARQSVAQRKLSATITSRLEKLRAAAKVELQPGYTLAN